MKSKISKLFCGMILVGICTACGTTTESGDANNKGTSGKEAESEQVFDDYTLTIYGEELELPVSFEEFDQFMQENTSYTLDDEERFYNGSGIDDEKLLAKEKEEFAYTYMYGDTVMEKYFIYVTLYNDSEESKPNKDCQVVGLRVGNRMDSVERFDTNILFTSIELKTGMEMTEEELKNMFGTYEDVSEGGMYVFDRYQDDVNTWDALTVSLKDGKIQHIVLKWADKSQE